MSNFGQTLPLSSFSAIRSRIFRVFQANLGKLRFTSELKYTRVSDQKSTRTHAIIISTANISPFYSQLPVLAPTGGKLVGLVTLGNLLSWISRGRASGKSPVSEVMFDFSSIPEVVTDPKDISKLTQAPKTNGVEGSGESKQQKTPKRKFVESEHPLLRRNVVREFPIPPIYLYNRANGPRSYSRHPPISSKQILRMEQRSRGNRAWRRLERRPLQAYRHCHESRLAILDGKADNRLRKPLPFLLFFKWRYGERTNGRRTDRRQH